MSLFPLNCNVNTYFDSKVCTLLQGFTYSRSIWLNACYTEILSKGYPFVGSHGSLEDIETKEIERRTCLAIRLWKSWTLDTPKPSASIFKTNNSKQSVSDVKIFNKEREGGRVQTFLATVSKEIWSVVRFWDVDTCKFGRGTNVSGHPPCIAEWRSKGALITGIAVNSGMRSDACMAISIHNER